MIVEWQAQALDDRDHAIAYLEQNNPRAALQLLETLVKATISLTAFPRRGRPGDAPGTRELVATRNYILIYEIDDAANKITILRLWHTSRHR